MMSAILLHCILPAVIATLAGIVIAFALVLPLKILSSPDEKSGHCETFVVFSVLLGPSLLIGMLSIALLSMILASSLGIVLPDMTIVNFLFAFTSVTLAIAIDYHASKFLSKRLSQLSRRTIHAYRSRRSNQ